METMEGKELVLAVQIVAAAAAARVGRAAITQGRMVVLAAMAEQAV